MTTYHVWAGFRLALTTTDKQRAEQLAAAVRDGHVEVVERELTAGERMAAERRAMAA